MAEMHEKNLRVEAIQEMAHNWIRSTNPERIEKRAYDWVNSRPSKSNRNSKAKIRKRR